jgi:PKD repeat protein
MIRSLYLILLLVSTINAKSQCGTLFPAEPFGPYERIEIRSERDGEATFIIPTVVHIHYGDLLLPIGALSVQPLLDECNADLRALNADTLDVIPEFADVIGDMNIELRLATRDEDGNCFSGILYHQYSPENGFPNTLDPTLNTRSYLNIHILPSINSFATLPGAVADPYDPTDVIVLSLSAAYPGARTLTHEVGHWAGLWHTFGQTPEIGVICGDDYIADTPPTAGDPLECHLDLQNCTPGVIENVQNFMDYSWCQVMFTQGQAQHAAAVLTDVTRVRAGVFIEENQIATGMIDPPTCSITADMYYRTAENCTGTTITFRAMAEGVLADSVHWEFTGGNITDSWSDGPAVTYLASGNYPVQLTVYGGGTSDVMQMTVAVNVPQGGSNGMPTITALPFTEGFENGFSLPQDHIVAIDNGMQTWQPFNGAGFASENCLYIPAGPIDQVDTIDLVIGNFDLSGLDQPAIMFKIAATNTGASSWQKVHVHMRDLCSNIMQGDLVGVQELYEFAVDNGNNFVPSDDAQWDTFIVNIPWLNFATAAEFKIRVTRSWNPPTFNAEAIYIDDFYVGELPVITSIGTEISPTDIQLFPNPANEQVRIQRAESEPVEVSIVDALGRIVHQAKFTDQLNIDVSDWNTGLYTVIVTGESDRWVGRLVVE